MSDCRLVPEQPLVFSPGLAATIGLEEAILLQQLAALYQHRPTRERQGYRWLTVERDYLLQLLPFWQPLDLHRVTRSLVDKGVILVESPPLHSHPELVFALDQPRQAVTPPRDIAADTPQPRRSASALSPNWAPSEDLLQLLALNHNIPRQFALDQLEDFIFYWRERGEPGHAWENRFRQLVISNWRRQQQQAAETAFLSDRSVALDNHWRPSEDAMEIMLRSGVDRTFIEEAIPEFILYWRERGDAPKELNSRFIQHIRIQWAKYSSSLIHSTEPRRISDDWQPDADVFDILRLSHIDEDFARALLPEFIVYWRDSNQLHSSWNSKFLQHVKFHWARQHRLEQAGHSHDGQQAAHRTGRTRDRSLADDLRDTSWAE